MDVEGLPRDGFRTVSAVLGSCSDRPRIQNDDSGFILTTSSCWSLAIFLQKFQPKVFKLVLFLSFGVEMRFWSCNFWHRWLHPGCEGDLSADFLHFGAGDFPVKSFSKKFSNSCFSWLRRRDAVLELQFLAPLCAVASAASAFSPPPPAPRQLQDFICQLQIAVGTAGLHLPPPDRSGHCRASSASSRSQCALPDISPDCQIPVGTAGLQPRLPDPSGHCRTSVATSRELQIAVSTAGLQPRTPDRSSLAPRLRANIDGCIQGAKVRCSFRCGFSAGSKKVPEGSEVRCASSGLVPEVPGGSGAVLVVVPEGLGRLWYRFRNVPGGCGVSSGLVPEGSRMLWSGSGQVPEGSGRFHEAGVATRVPSVQQAKPPCCQV
eukprot:s3152_g5.t1